MNMVHVQVGYDVLGVTYAMKFMNNYAFRDFLSSIYM